MPNPSEIEREYSSGFNDGITQRPQLRSQDPSYLAGYKTGSECRGIGLGHGLQAYNKDLDLVLEKNGCPRICK